jgi:hypothetical protein
MAAATLLKLNLSGWGTTRQLTVFNPATNVYYIDSVSDEIRALVGINGLPESPLEIDFPTSTDRDTFITDLSAGLLSTYTGSPTLVLDNGRDTGRAEQTTTTTTAAPAEITTTEAPAFTTTAPPGGITTTTTLAPPTLSWSYTDLSFNGTGTFKIFKNGIQALSRTTNGSGSITVRTNDIISASITTASGIDSSIVFRRNSSQIATAGNDNGSVVLPAQSPLLGGSNYELIAEIVDLLEF